MCGDSSVKGLLRAGLVLEQDEKNGIGSPPPELHPGGESMAALQHHMDAPCPAELSLHLAREARFS